MKTILLRGLGCVLSAFLAAPFCAVAADAFPTHPARLIVPYPAGGPNDVLARMLGAKLGEYWGQQVVVDNRPGAGGNLATELTARAAPDGYTMVLVAMAYAVNPSIYSKVPYSFDQFAPVSIVAKGPLVLVVSPSLGVNSVKELIAAAKAKPGQLQYASDVGGFILVEEYIRVGAVRIEGLFQQSGAMQESEACQGVNQS